MKKIKLTRGKYAIVDAATFAELAQYRWHFSNGTACRWDCSPPKRLLQIAHSILKPGRVKKFVDHINGDRLDNRKENLRRATPTENQCNAKKHCDGKLKYKGICKRHLFRNRKKPYYAVIQIKGKRYFSPMCRTQKEAAIHYNNLAVKHHGKFARLNAI